MTSYSVPSNDPIVQVAFASTDDGAVSWLSLVTKNGNELVIFTSKQAGVHLGERILEAVRLSRPKPWSEDAYWAEERGEE